MRYGPVPTQSKGRLKEDLVRDHPRPPQATTPTSGTSSNFASVFTKMQNTTEATVPVYPVRADIVCPSPWDVHRRATIDLELDLCRASKSRMMLSNEVRHALVDRCDLAKARLYIKNLVHEGVGTVKVWSNPLARFDQLENAPASTLRSPSQST